MYAVVTNNSLCFGGFRALEAGHTAGAVFNPVNNDVGVSRVAFRARARLDAVFSPSRRRRAPPATIHHDIRSVRYALVPSPGRGDADRTREPHPTGRPLQTTGVSVHVSLARSAQRRRLYGVRIPSVVLYGLLFLKHVKSKCKCVFSTNDD